MKSINWESWNVKEEEQLEKLGFYDDDLDDEDEYIDDPQQMMMMAYAAQQKPQLNQIITPFGIFLPETPFKPSDRWSCWIGHTNFRISKELLMKLWQNVEGISSVAVIDIYSFCIAIAPMFNDGEVKLNVQNYLCNNKSIAQDALINIIKTEMVHNKYWTVLIKPDKSLEYVFSNSIDQDYINKVRQIEDLHKTIGGNILTSGEANDNPETK